MTFATGQPESKRGRCAFTLIELCLVMALFVIVFGIVLPAMEGFFRGRTLDSEARRFLEATRYGQSRAISEGVPVELWINPKQGAYGLEALSGYTETKTNALYFPVNSTIEISVAAPPSATALTRSNYWTAAGTTTRDLPKIFFQPDGAIGERSAPAVCLKQNGQQVWIAEDPSHLRYEIQAPTKP